MNLVAWLRSQVRQWAACRARRLEHRRSLIACGARVNSDAATEAMNRVCDGLDLQVDPFVQRAARRSLTACEW